MLPFLAFLFQKWTEPSGSKSVCLLNVAPQGKEWVGGKNVVIVQGMVNPFSRRVTDTPVLVEGLLEVSSLTSHAEQGQHPLFFPSSSRYSSLCCIQSHGGGRHLNPSAFSRRAHSVKACGTSMAGESFTQKSKKMRDQRKQFSVGYLDVFAL